MELQIIDSGFSVCKISSVEQADLTGGYAFLQKTPDEISLVCESGCAPSNAVAVENGWKAFKISGTLDFGLIGIIAGISKILAAAGIGVFVISTYDTDYILMKEYNFDKGIGALKDNGYVVK